MIVPWIEQRLEPPLTMFARSIRPVMSGSGLIESVGEYANDGIEFITRRDGAALITDVPPNRLLGGRDVVETGADPILREGDNRDRPVAFRTPDRIVERRFDARDLEGDVDADPDEQISFMDLIRSFRPESVRRNGPIDGRNAPSPLSPDSYPDR